MPEFLIRVKTLTPQRVVWARRRAATTDIGLAIQDALETVWRGLNTLESVTVGTALTRYLAYGAEEVDLEAGFPIAEDIVPPSGLELGMLDGGVAATTLHNGPYGQLPLAYEALEHWMIENGRTPAAPPWEIYWVNPSEVATPEELRTEVVWPIEPIADELT